MEVNVRSGERLLKAFHYVPQTPGKHPAALFVHGIPGNEKNHDLAQRLQALGWEVLILHLGGAWGSEGQYNILEQPDDVIAGLDFLMADDEAVDENLLVVVGYSLGVRTAITAALRDARIAALVLISGIHNFGEMTLSDQALAESAPLLSGVTPDDIRRQWGKLITQNNPVDVIRELTPRPVLVIHGTGDDTVPSYAANMLANAAPEIATLILIDDADHGFTGKRDELIEKVSGWLEAWRKQA